MEQGPLVNEQIEAGARFLHEFQKHLPLQSAFWLKDSEEGNWYLNIASEQITDENFDLVYGEVGDVAVAMADPSFDVFQVKVIGATDPLAQAALEMQRRYPARRPIRFRDRIFGGIHVEEGYIYPLPIPAPTS